MLETCVVYGIDGSVIHWHEPSDRSSVHIPDKPDLWEVIWNNRDRIVGIAHTHPGSGPPAPSQEDVTTFAAVEAALGKRLFWPIATVSDCRFFSWMGPRRLDYYRVSDRIFKQDAASWLPELKRRSGLLGICPKCCDPSCVGSNYTLEKEVECLSRQVATLNRRLVLARDTLGVIAHYPGEGNEPEEASWMRGKAWEALSKDKDAAEGLILTGAESGPPESKFRIQVVDSEGRVVQGHTVQVNTDFAVLTMPESTPSYEMTDLAHVIQRNLSDTGGINTVLCMTEGLKIRVMRLIPDK